MNPNDELYREYLEELRDLADFRLNYTLGHTAAGLAWEDPDVKRVIEALAFFGARTQVAALKNVDATRHRLYQQFFPYLLSPLSAMAMVQAKPTGHLTEVLNLPAGIELALQPDRGGLAIFRTTRALRVLPLRIEAVKQETLAGAGVRLLLSFRADYPLNEQPEILSLHINYLNDFAISLKLFHFLKRSLRDASVQFGSYDSQQAGAACKFSLGNQPPDSETDEWRHPLEVERYYFHFPQQELYLELELPSAPRNWRSFTVALDCCEPCPRQVNINRDVFQLFTVPLANNQRAMAQPVICAGTQERYTIRHPKPEFGFSLQQVLGVYEVAEEGMLPFRPGILAGGNGSYEIEKGPPQEGGGNLHWLVPHFPSAFEQPRTLAVEALWLQPWYDQRLQNSHVLQAFRLQTQGVQWELLGTAIPHSENRQFVSTAPFLNLLTLMHKPCLNSQDTKGLLLAMGSVSAGQFQGAFRDLADLRIEEEPLGGAEGRMTKQIYHLRFKSQLDESRELIEAFVRHVGQVLDLWIADALVEARLEVQDETERAVD